MDRQAVKPQPLVTRTRDSLYHFIQGDMHGVQYAVSIFFATVILWVAVHRLGKSNPIWAISSMVATSDPVINRARLLFRSRLINTLVGCGVGLLCIAIGGSRAITLPIAMAVTVLLSSYVVRIPLMWRHGPITAAFVIAASFSNQSRVSGIEAGVTRVSEVIFGSMVGLAVAWMVSLIWPPAEPEPPKPEATIDPSSEVGEV